MPAAPGKSGGSIDLAKPPGGQFLQQAFIRRGKRVVAQLFRCDPTALRTTQGLWLSGKPLTIEGMKFHLPIGIGERNRVPTYPHLHPQGCLLEDFPQETILKRLVGLTLASRKLPEIGQVRIAPAAGDENTIPLPDNADGNGQGRRTGARCMRTVHFPQPFVMRASRAFYTLTPEP